MPRGLITQVEFEFFLRGLRCIPERRDISIAGESPAKSSIRLKLGDDDSVRCALSTIAAIRPIVFEAKTPVALRHDSCAFGRVHLMIGIGQNMISGFPVRVIAAWPLAGISMHPSAVSVSIFSLSR